MKIQRKRMLWRIPLLVTILMAIFWGVWYLATGDIPVISQIKWTTETAIQLPFGISRLWDIPFAFVWTFILIFLFTHKKIKDDEKLIFIGLISGLVSGLLFGLVFGLVTGLVLGIGVGLGIGLGTALDDNLGFDLGFDLSFDLVFGLVFGLAFGLAASLIAGLAIGLVLGLSVSLAFGLMSSLPTGLKFVFSTKTFQSFSRWFTGK